MCFQRVEINVSFTELYICICLSSIYSQNVKADTENCKRTDGMVLHSQLYLNSTLAGQVYRAERETQMQKTCIQRVEKLFLASVISDRFLK